MLKLFEEYTKELTEKEKRELERLVEKLKKRTSLNPWTNNKDSKGRKMIQTLRNSGYLICSNSRGYFMKATKKEKEEYIESFRQRIRSMKKTLRAQEMMK